MVQETKSEVRPTAEFKAKLLFMLQLSSEAWMSAHKDEVRGKIHWHTVHRSATTWEFLFHLLGSPSMACGLVLTRGTMKFQDGIPVVASAADAASHAFHVKLYRNGNGCLVCEPMRTAEVFCAVRRDRAGLRIQQDEALPYIYAAKAEKEKEGTLAVADRLGHLLDELPPLKLRLT